MEKGTEKDDKMVKPTEGVQHEEPASVGIHAVECYSSAKLLRLSLWYRLRAVYLLHYIV